LELWTEFGTPQRDHGREGGEIETGGKNQRTGGFKKGSAATMRNKGPGSQRV
jgi:hypothetical protein